MTWGFGPCSSSNNVCLTKSKGSSRTSKCPVAVLSFSLLDLSKLQAPKKDLFAPKFRNRHPLTGVHWGSYNFIHFVCFSLLLRSEKRRLTLRVEVQAGSQWNLRPGSIVPWTTCNCKSKFSPSPALCWAIFQGIFELKVVWWWWGRVLNT